MAAAVEIDMRGWTLCLRARRWEFGIHEAHSDRSHVLIVGCRSYIFIFHALPSVLVAFSFARDRTARMTRVAA